LTAHRDDPLADCRLDSDDFARMACHVCDFAQRVGAPVGAVLEGGYHVPALAAGVISMMRALLGDGEAESIVPELTYTPRAASYVGQHRNLC
jgi:acetoin utilization deacetylase AcuC-like enzyme